MMSIQRIHTGWNQKDKERKISQVAVVVAVNIWKNSKKTLLNLENEGIEGETCESRLKILCELSFFQIYILFNELLIREEPNRENILKDVAKKIELTLIENVRDHLGATKVATIICLPSGSSKELLTYQINYSFTGL